VFAATMVGEGTMSTEELQARVADNPAWYHTLQVAPGVVTDGYVDWRAKAAAILPDDLSGKRCLDIGTYDGFWAFEMEQRGGDVVAIDVERLDSGDWPPVNRAKLERRNREWGLELGKGFRIAHELRGSSVERVICSVYDLTPEAIGGAVDFAFLGALLLHLREPIRALEAIRGALKPGGTLKVVECVSLRETLRAPRSPVARFEPLIYDFNWWRPNLAGLMAYVRTCGFENVRRGRFHRPPSKPEMRTWYADLEARAPS
jgi:tRNA (mo5U34)-methyltransferase